MTVEPATLGDMTAFVYSLRQPFRPFAEDLYWGMRDACERARGAGMSDSTPVAAVDRLDGLYQRFVALQAQ